MKKVWLSTTYYMDEAVQGLSPNAERAMTRAIAFCGNAENGGKMRLTAFLMLGLQRPNSLVQELLAARILVPSDDPEFVEFRKWDEWQSDGNALVERQKKDAARQAKRRKALREGADASRDKSRDVTGTEKRRGKEVLTKVSSSAYVSTAGETVSPPEPDLFGGSDSGPAVVEADPVLADGLDHPGGESIDRASWRMVRAAVPATHPQAVRAALALEVKMLARQGQAAADVEAALALWMGLENVGPRILPSLVSQVIKGRSAPARTAAARPSTTDARVQAVQAAKAAERENGRPNIFAVRDAQPRELAL